MGRVKKLPEYEIIKGNENCERFISLYAEDTQVVAEYNTVNIHPNLPVLSAYTKDFVPLQVVLSNYYFRGLNGRYVNNRVANKENIGMKDINRDLPISVLSYVYYNGDISSSISYVKQALNNNFDNNGFLVITGYISSHIKVEEASDEFTRGLSGRIGFRNINCYMSGMNLYLCHDNIYNPLISTVIKHEDLNYQKIQFASTGKIDVKRCIVLVDRDLDNPEYENKNIRTLYKKRLEPEILSKGFNIAKVPSQLIKDQFIKRIEAPKNILQLKGFVENLSSQFKSGG